MSLQYLKKEASDKLIFYMQINIQVSYNLILTLWDQSFPQDDTITIDGHDQAFSKDSK